MSHSSQITPCLNTLLWAKKKAKMELPTYKVTRASPIDKELQELKKLMALNERILNRSEDPSNKPWNIARRTAILKRLAKYLQSNMQQVTPSIKIKVTANKPVTANLNLEGAEGSERGRARPERSDVAECTRPTYLTLRVRISIY